MSTICALTDPDPFRAEEMRPILAELGRRGENVVAAGRLNGIHPDCLLFDADSAGGRGAKAALRVPSIACHVGPALPESLPSPRRLNLVLMAKELQPGVERFDGSYRWVGRCLDPVPPEQASRIDLGHDPVIYVSPGALFEELPDFHRACMEAFEGTLYQVFWTAVARAGQSDPVRDYPSPELLQWAVLCISEAGPRTVDACLREDVPMLLLARNPAEVSLAHRVVELGAGLRLDDADLTSGRIRELALRLVNEPAFSEGASAAGRAVRSAGGTALACDEIQAFLKIESG